MSPTVSETEREAINIYIIAPLFLRYSKEPLFVTKPLSTEAVEGDTVIIFCEVVGDPKPEVIWLRDFLKVNEIFQIHCICDILRLSKYKIDINRRYNQKANYKENFNISLN